MFISIREALGQEEIAVVQTTSLNDKGGYLLSTRLLHSSGQSIESVMLLDRWQDARLKQRDSDAAMLSAMLRDNRQSPGIQVETNPLAEAWRGARYGVVRPVG